MRVSFDDGKCNSTPISTESFSDAGSEEIAGRRSNLARYGTLVFLFVDGHSISSGWTACVATSTFSLPAVETILKS